MRYHVAIYDLVKFIAPFPLLFYFLCRVFLPTVLFQHPKTTSGMRTVAFFTFQIITMVQSNPIHLAEALYRTILILHFLQVLNF